ncbi:MAG: response regulator [Proteobacteria bacterium]|nr:MAG: response regulator [Pseudomonadota bacterium]
MDHILVVEDEDIIRSAVKKLLEHNNYQVTTAGSVDEAIAHLDRIEPALVITDLRLPGRSGTDLIELVSPTPVLVMTSYASLRSAVDSMKLGAVDYIAKPFDYDEILTSVRTILQKKSPRGSNGSEVKTGQDKTENDRKNISRLIYGECEPMKKVFRLIEKVSPTDTTVLIQGESGTGKELAARALHQNSLRANKPLICVNCAAIPETLIESELFGHEKGAFTGAVNSRNGLVEAADGGTLFLDEIGELPLEAQARLLRVLQEGEIRRVGSTRSLQVDVRLIAATHRNLKSLSKIGEFREDLYYRLNVMQIRLPPLRERGQDVLGLAERLRERMCNKLDKHEVQLSPDAMHAIQQHNWPGNVRELENAMERAIILCEGGIITPEELDLEAETDTPSSTGLANPEETGAPHKKEQGLSLEDYFQQFVLENQDKMSETELAQKLGISRKSLWERRQRIGIPRKKSG